MSSSASGSPAGQSAFPERISVLALDFTPAAMEFHRRNMAARGYRLDGAITPRRFMLTDGLGEPQELLDGKTYYVATFVRIQGGEDSADTEE